MALNVLVVDDSFVMRDMIIKTLRLSELTLGDIHEASNGQEGLDLLDNQWIDLALVDIHMPVMNGEEMLERIRGNPDTSDLAVIVVSSESNTSRIEMLVEKGARFVHKPFTPEALREIVTGMLGELHE